MSASVVLHKSARTLLPVLALAGSIIGADGSGWEKLTFSETEPINAVATFDSILLVGTDVTIKRSSDGGATWTASEFELELGRVTALATVGRRMLAAQRDKLYSSSDAGVSWIRASGTVPYKTVVGFRTSGDSVFALMTLYPATDPAPEAMLLSLDGGLSWSDGGFPSGSMPYDPVAIGGDTLLAIRNGIIEFGLEGGARWSPLPNEAGRGLFGSLAIHGGFLYATSGGTLLRSPDYGADFSEVTVDPAVTRPYHLAAYGETVCASTRRLISCSGDGGANWELARHNFHNFDNQIMAMGDFYLYIGHLGNWANEGIWRFDFAAKTWSHLLQSSEARLKAGPQHNGALFAAYGERIRYAMKVLISPPIMISKNHGETWDSLPEEYMAKEKLALFMSKGWKGMLARTSGSNLDPLLYFAKEGESAWESLPINQPEGIPIILTAPRHTPIAASGSRFFVCSSTGRLWKGDMEAKTWSKINTPEDMQVCRSGAAGDFTYLAASDSSLYVSTPSGLWRLPLSEGTVAVTPSKDSARHRSTKATITTSSAGSGKVLVIPAPSGRSRPGNYDFKGIRQPEVQSGKGSP